MKRIFLATTLLVGCAGITPTAHHGATLLLTPRISAGSYQSQATVNPYTRSSIDHLTLRMFQGATELSSRTLLNAQLDNPVAFSNLKSNTPYRIKAYAYLADNTLISHDDPSSWLDITTETDDRPAIAALPVHLVDLPFNAQATSSLQVTPGNYSPKGPEKMAFLITGLVTNVAGNGSSTFAGDGGSATSASLNYPWNVTVDAQGTFYIADYLNHRVRKVSNQGAISTVAGNGATEFSGDGGAATASSLYSPLGVTLDKQGNLYIADASNYRVRRVDKTTQVITTVAGNGTSAYAGEGVPATSSGLGPAYDLEFDSLGNLYIPDYNYHRIYKLGTDGLLVTVAGNGATGSVGDGGPATSASINKPTGIAFDSLSNLFIADYANHRIRKVDRSGIITTVAGNGNREYSGDNGPATLAGLNDPLDVAVDALDNLYISDRSNGRIRKVDANGIITTVVAGLSAPCGITFGPQGELYVADKNSQRIKVIR